MIDTPMVDMAPAFLNTWNVTSTDATPITTNTAVAVLAAQPGFSHYITSVSFTNTHATVSTLLSIVDNNTTDVQVFTTFLSLNSAAKSDVVCMTFPTPIKLREGSSIDLKAATTGANIYWNLTGFTR